MFVTFYRCQVFCTFLDNCKVLKHRSNGTFRYKLMCEGDPQVTCLVLFALKLFYESVSSNSELTMYNNILFIYIRSRERAFESVTTKLVKNK